jgi:hypothetical protein
MDENHYTHLMGRRRKALGGLRAGQVIVIVAVAAVALVAIIGLSVDGGRLLVVRRDGQNAGDAATLAATLALCSGGTETQIIAAGESAAAANGYIDGVNNTTVLIDPDPPLGELSADACAECSVLVRLNREIEPYFIQIVYSGTLASTIRAVGTCNPDNIPIGGETTPGGVPVPDIGVLWSGGPECVLNVQGNNAFFGGNVHSNGTLKFNPSGNIDSTWSCNDPFPAGAQAGWIWGNITYGGSSSSNNWNDSKIFECDWGQSPDAEVDPVVCGASCAAAGAPGSVTNDNDPEQVTPYVDPPGSLQPVWPAEADYTLADFADGGPVSIEIGADYHVVADEDEFETAYLAHGPGGVYYVTGNIRLHKSQFDYDITATIVAEGQIDYHLEDDWAGWYPQSAPPVYRLALMAWGDGPTASCGVDDLKVTSTNAYFTGIMFAPYGEADFNTSGVDSQEACIIAYQVSISSATTLVTCDPGDQQTQGSINLSQ